MEAHAEIFVGRVEAAAAVAAPATRAVLGLQEFPRAGTPRSDVFEAAFRRAGFGLARARKSCVLAYRGFPAACAPEVLADGEGSRVDALAIARGLTRASDGAPRFDKKVVDGLEKTTALRTFAARLDGCVFHVVHVKEPKSAAAVGLLAAYLDAVRGACAARADEPYCVLVRVRRRERRESRHECKSDEKSTPSSMVGPRRHEHRQAAPRRRVPSRARRKRRAGLADRLDDLEAPLQAPRPVLRREQVPRHRARRKGQVLLRCK